MTPNEQQRLDAGPRVTPDDPFARGDGVLGAADGTAIDAFARHDAMTDFDPLTPNWQPSPAGGPLTISNLSTPCMTLHAPEGMDATAVPEAAAVAAVRVVRLVSGAGTRGSDVTVEIEMNAQGNEAGTQYSLRFDPTVLSISGISGVDANPDIMPGAGAPMGTTLNVNAEQAAHGTIGIVENFNTDNTASMTALRSGSESITTIRFHVLAGAAAGASNITFDDAVVNRVTADTNAMMLSATYDQTGRITIPASAGVTVSGRVTSPEGAGLRNATVSFTNSQGVVTTATTSSFGFFSFENVTTGQTYTFRVSSRLYRFASESILVTDNLTLLDFVGLE